MYCTKCGGPNEGTATFCTQCGERLNDSSVPAANAGQVANAHAPMESPAEMGAPQQGNHVRGCFGSAWDDIVHSPGFVKKLLLMGLLQFVPILNWTTFGYAYTWGKDAGYGMRDSLPGHIVTGMNFKIGAIAVLLGLLCGVALYAQAYVIGLVFNQVSSAITVLLVAVLSVFMIMFLNLALMRATFFDSLDSGFSVGKIMNALKQKMGTAFCVIAVPAFIVLAFSIVVVLVVALVSAVTGAAAVYQLSSSAAFYSGAYGSSDVVAASGGAFFLLAVMYIAGTWLSYVASMFGLLLTARATGHYVFRYVPEWHDERKLCEAAAAYRGSSVSTEGAAGNGNAPLPVHDAPNARAQATTPANRAGNTVNGQPREGNGGNETVVAKADYSETVIGETVVGDTTVGDTIVDSDNRLYRDGQTTVASEMASTDMLGNGHNAKHAVGGAETVRYDSPTAYVAPAIELVRSNGSACTISSFPAVIGQSAEADVCIDDNPRISRKHAQILEDSGMFAVEDLNSTNHTYVQGYVVEPGNPTILSDGDELKLANEVLKVRFL